MTTLFIAPQHRKTLELNQLETFNQIWNHPIDWIDTPNQNRGGWSGVGCVEIPMGNKHFTLFVKKQQNHTSRSLLHPIKGVPTFAREFEAIRYLKAYGVMTPEVVFFAQCSVKEGQQAILVTEMLESYLPLDQMLLDQKKSMSLLRQRMLLSCIAKAVKRMHELGIQHRALYAKHIFIKPHAESFEVAFIDLEKSRRMILPMVQSINDLITLNYRTGGWSLSHRIYFFKSYFATSQLSTLDKWLCRWISYKTAQKLHQRNNQHA
jgi:hypothetical protein